MLIPELVEKKRAEKGCIEKFNFRFLNVSLFSKENSVLNAKLWSKAHSSLSK